MTNIDSSFGLRPYRHAAGGCSRLNEYSVASGYAKSIFNGDVISMTGLGKNIELAADGAIDAMGVFVGCRYVNEAGEQKFSSYWPKNTVASEIVASVHDDPNIVYEVQCNELALEDVGALVDWKQGEGNPRTGTSALIADVAAGTATEGKALRLVELKPVVNNGYGEHAKALVQFAAHVLKTGAAGAGGE